MRERGEIFHLLVHSPRATGTQADTQMQTLGHGLQVSQVVLQLLPYGALVRGLRALVHPYSCEGGIFEAKNVFNGHTVCWHLDLGLQNLLN